MWLLPTRSAEASDVPARARCQSPAALRQPEDEALCHRAVTRWVSSSIAESGDCDGGRLRRRSSHPMSQPGRTVGTPFDSPDAETTAAIVDAASMLIVVL